MVALWWHCALERACNMSYVWVYIYRISEIWYLVVRNELIGLHCYPAQVNR